MVNIITNITKTLIYYLKYPIIAIVIILAFFYLLSRIYLVAEMKKTGRKPKRKPVRTKKESALYKLFYQLPRMIAIDRLNYDPDTFDNKGLVIFEGIQGRGKTISLIKYACDMQDCYPKALTIANLGFTRADEKLTNWQQLITYCNDNKGVIAIIDETQNWFSSKDSRNFPPEMLSVVTQNRKNRRIILGTAQSFYMLAKDVRTQCTEVRSCYTLFHCLTFVIRKFPIINSAGDVEKWKYRGSYWFVHTPELRDCYDTYETIQRFSEVGFVERAPDTNNIINIVEAPQQKKNLFKRN